MWRHWPFVILFLSVPVQYFVSKYWVGFSWRNLIKPDPVDDNPSASYANIKASNYYLQRTFATLERKLKLQEWSRWPEKLVQCAKRLLFDYISLVPDPEEEEPTTGDAAPETGQPPPPAPTHTAPKPKTKEHKNFHPDEEYDENKHFAGSRDPRSPRHPDVLYRVGQVIEHTQQKYRGVILGWDHRPVMPSKVAKALFAREKPEMQEQPFYAVLVDTRDRVTPQIDYIAQQVIRPLMPPIVIVHPVLEAYFEAGRPDARSGCYRMRPFHQQVYPED
ncbi:uncharacterized protein LOC129597358 [Paramacrobiotus metropolitanus]|uniref:uncharacterized protein LOC129597358 n=1 Tax=Paramacrobiotus metropolitanus TaxID=2943436 RepID=UPI0024459615|nr:uncharacterized protein LOC129597358 [Paramacrobiotus metropolitanus]